LPRQKSPRAPKKYLDELRSKVEFLTDKNRHDLKFKVVAKNIGTSDANLHNYLYKDKYLTRDKSRELLGNLDEFYKEKLQEWKPPLLEPSDDREPSPEIRSIADYTTTRIELQALKELIFDYVSKSASVDVAELHKQLEAKIAEIQNRSVQ
jgi:cyanate lyase